MDLLSYLSQATPDEWHQVAGSWNWDTDPEPLRWIIRHPLRDRGTALLVYWYSGPRYFAQYLTRSEVPSYELEGYDLMTEIEQAYLANRYTRAEIAFTPHDDGGYDWTAGYADVPLRRPIPELMYATSPGHQATRRADFDDGYPPGVQRDG
jgi:hypothetical protein